MSYSFPVYPLFSNAGVGLKQEHGEAIFATKPDIGWFEVHPENYMGEGGAPHHFLRKIREDYPLSLHGVGLSLGSEKALSQDHLNRLKHLYERYQPVLMSEHLAWSTHDDVFYNDLLPLPYTDKTLMQLCDHIDQAQEHVGARFLIENPATYVVFEESTYDEIDFIKCFARRTGCGLLLDLNNVFVSCTNHGRDPYEYLSHFPLELLGEIHLAGYAIDEDDAGEMLLIDAHDRAVSDPVWQLYRWVIGRIGAVPTLIEWDHDVPPWDVLYKEAKCADQIILELSKARSQVQTQCVS